MTKRKAWTKDDNRELRKLAGTEHARRIARRLKRTEGAVRQYAWAQKLSLRVRA